MTTISYNHKDKQISCDSRLTDNRTIRSDSWRKWYELDGSINFACGCSSEIPLFLAEYDWGEKSGHEYQCIVLQVCDDEVFLLCTSEDGIFNKYPIRYDEAIGSGSNFALSAMDFGKSSSEAVEYAITRDSGSGGKVHTYDIATKQFI